MTSQIILKSITLNNFNPHLPYGRWLVLTVHWMIIRYFNPHLPYGRWPGSILCCIIGNGISIHTFLTEGDQIQFFRFVHILISIHTFLTEGDTFARKYTIWKNISIHTFLTEGDWNGQAVVWYFTYFNPHLPYGRWHYHSVDHPKPYQFQSTPSLRKVTTLTGVPPGDWKDFNPHLPYGRWRYNFARLNVCMIISIHTFLTEGDDILRFTGSGLDNFNPHLPYGRWLVIVSLSLYQIYFNPHLPYGRWLLCVCIPPFFLYFNTHLPYGRWRSFVFKMKLLCYI